MNCGSTSNTSSGGQRQIEVLSNDSCSRTGMMSGLSLLGGMALGAGLMYLLDPDEGSDRRKTVGNLASGAISASGSALQSGWDKLKDTASRVYDAASEGASAFKDKLSDGAEYVTDNRYARQISKSARRAKGEAADRLDYLMHGGSRYSMSPVGQGLCAIACLGLGVGAMYFLDPRDGARRRNVFRDKFLSAFGRMATSLERQSRNIWNRTTGMIHETRSGFSNEPVDDQTEVQRVRAVIGRYADNVGDIDVQCTSGQITLRGPIAASQLNGLLKATRGVRGVNGIDNQLDVRTTMQGGQSGQRRGTQRPQSAGASGSMGAPLCPPGTSSTSTTRI